jgi:hypothetical protein
MMNHASLPAGEKADALKGIFARHAVKAAEISLMVVQFSAAAAAGRATPLCDSFGATLLAFSTV